MIPDRLQHKNASNIEYLGYLLPETVANRYKDADVFVFPSLCDGFGLAALEAMASGLPVICSANSGVADLIQDGVNGFVVETGDAGELRDHSCLMFWGSLVYGAPGQDEGHETRCNGNWQKLFMGKI